MYFVILSFSCMPLNFHIGKTLPFFRADVFCAHGLVALAAVRPLHVQRRCHHQFPKWAIIGSAQIYIYIVAWHGSPSNKDESDIMPLLHSPFIRIRTDPRMAEMVHGSIVMPGGGTNVFGKRKEPSFHSNNMYINNKFCHNKQSRQNI